MALPPTLHYPLVSRFDYTPSLATRHMAHYGQTKPEVHKILHYRHRRTTPRPQITCTESFVKFGHVIFEICKRRDRQTDTHTDTVIAILCTLTKEH